MGRLSSKKPKAVFSNVIVMKFGMIDLQLNRHQQLTESDFYKTSYIQDGGHDVISHRKVLPSGECTRSVRPAHMQQRPPVPGP